MSEMTEMLINRTGEPPLKFRGRSLVQVGGRIYQGQEQNRWHELEVFRTEGGNYVLAIGYHTQWQGEDDHLVALVCKQAGDVVARVRGYDPAEHVVGYPPGPGYADKQARLIETIRRRYNTLATDLYEQLGSEFAEVIE
jgi:hypothetical protein